MHRRKITTTCIFLILSKLSIAQQIKAYNGAYLNGEASYQYFENTKRERVFNGYFNYQNLDKSFIIKGFYKNGKKTGSWIYNYTNHRFSLIFITGQMNVNYQDGLLEGKAELNISYSSNLRDGETQGIIKEIMTFQKNTLFGAYQSVGKSNILTNTIKASTNSETRGNFDKNGYRTGEWKVFEQVYNKPLIKNKLYHEGYCYKLETIDNSTGKIVESYDSTYFLHKITSSTDQVFTYNGDGYYLSYPKYNISFTQDLLDDGENNLTPNNSGERKIIKVKSASYAETLEQKGFVAIASKKLDEALLLNKRALSIDSNLLKCKLRIPLILLKNKSSNYYDEYIQTLNSIPLKNHQNLIKELRNHKEEIIELSSGDDEMKLIEPIVVLIDQKIKLLYDDEVKINIEKNQRIELEKRLAKEEEEQKSMFKQSDLGRLYLELKSSLASWEVKDAFEKEQDYQVRIATQKEKQLVSLTKSLNARLKGINESLTRDNLTIIGEIADYETDSEIMTVQPKTEINSDNIKTVNVALANGFNKSLSKDYNLISRNSSYNFIVSPKLARAIFSEPEAQIIIIPKKFCFYENSFTISEAFIIFNFDYSDDVVTDIKTANNIVSIETVVANQANPFNEILKTKPKKKSIELSTFKDLEDYFKRNSKILNKPFYYHWKIQDNTTFKKESFLEIKDETLFVTVKDLDL